VAPCPYCRGGFVRRLPAEYVEGDPVVTATSVHLEHSEPVCNEFASKSRSCHSRDESVIHVPWEIERLDAPLRRALLAVL